MKTTTAGLLALLSTTTLLGCSDIEDLTGGLKDVSGEVYGAQATFVNQGSTRLTSASLADSCAATYDLGLNGSYFIDYVEVTGEGDKPLSSGLHIGTSYSEVSKVPTSPRELGGDWALLKAHGVTGSHDLSPNSLMFAVTKEGLEGSDNRCGDYDPARAEVILGSDDGSGAEGPPPPAESNRSGSYTLRALPVLSTVDADLGARVFPMLDSGDQGIERAVVRQLKITAAEAGTTLTIDGDSYAVEPGDTLTVDAPLSARWYATGPVSFDAALSAPAAGDGPARYALPTGLAAAKQALIGDQPVVVELRDTGDGAVMPTLRFLGVELPIGLTDAGEYSDPAGLSVWGYVVAEREHALTLELLAVYDGEAYLNGKYTFPRVR